MYKEEWLKKGFADESVDKSIDLKAAIDSLRKEKNAVILAHYYQTGDIQDIADYVGDSLALAQWAAKTEADIIVLCGVHFMGETAKILCPDKKVLVPDLNAGCSLADSCPADKFAQFVKEHPDHTVISYVNTTAAVKAVTDIVVTSTNAKQIVESFPKDEKLIFGPDRNLGNYINSVTNRNMLLWDGACHVHEQFSVEKIVELKKQYPDALILAHPECKGAVLALADFVGSTAAILKYYTQPHTSQNINYEELAEQIMKVQPNAAFSNAKIETAVDEVIKAEQNLGKEITQEDLLKSIRSKEPDITKKDLEICFNAFYRPDNMFIIAVGNIDKDETIKIIKAIKPFS